MKAEIVGFTEKTLAEYKFTKEIDGPFIKEKINTEISFLDTEYATLLAKTVQGEDREAGIVSKACGENLFSKDVYIKHNEGEFDMQLCEFNKKITFTNPLDCLIKKEINIFDYTSTLSKPTQGAIEKQLYTNSYLYYLGSIDGDGGKEPLRLDQILYYLGAIPNRENIGFYIYHISVTSIPEIGPNKDKYDGHLFEINVSFIRVTLPTQIGPNWKELPPGEGVGYYYAAFTPAIWNPPINTIIISNSASLYVDGDNSSFYDQRFSAGNINKYPPEISNTFSLNEILLDIFECSGLTLVSNFLGINADSTQPNNKEYQYALDNCQHLKITQSYDIIKATAIQDSFDKSGLVKTKDLLEDLCFMGNLKIVPDTSAGLVRIEHISYFSRKGADLKNKAYKLSKLKLNEKDVDSEEFFFARDTKSADFYKVTIDYKNLDLYKEPNAKKYSAKLILTDVFGTLNNTEYEKDDFKKLFYIMATDGEAIIDFNYPLSMRKIVTTLYTSNRPSKAGLIDGVETIFDSFSSGFSGKIELQNSLISWDLLQPFHTVFLKEGSFQIEELEIDETDLLTIKIIK